MSGQGITSPGRPEAECEPYLVRYTYGDGSGDVARFGVVVGTRCIGWISAATVAELRGRKGATELMPPPRVHYTPEGDVGP